MKRPEIITSIRKMKRCLINPPFLLIFLFLFSNATHIHHNASYDHLQLVFTWPNTFCLNEHVACKTPVPQNFQVHGLWPANKVGKTLQTCTKPGSIEWALDKYEKQLATSWPTLRSDMTNRQFWQHEWNKHGSCAMPRMNVAQYLQLIISLKSRFNLLNALTTNNIKPDNSAYKRFKVEAAIAQETQGKHFYISCLNLKKHTLIREVYICLDLDGHEVISCPSSNYLRGCGLNKDLMFPAASK